MFFLSFLQSPSPRRVAPLSRQEGGTGRQSNCKNTQKNRNIPSDMIKKRPAHYVSGVFIDFCDKAFMPYLFP